MGKRLMQKMADERKKFINNRMCILGSIYSQKEANRIKKSVSIITGEKKHLVKDFDVWNELRDSITDFVSSKEYNTRREDFRKIMIDASKKIRKLKA
jgi:hypothetical protein